ncbi:hypothetical protein M011DRAFT_405900 [Sporormia fimetaria CBS 119925]|uniref:F-box domain-containing protein n=1 Tax=Sporormia fimetaria CBS 119925 TaxID=1340428 RepID=A0A6A6V561_9PLEO|nr:hypothetical protein M011DRAFT_405900 [Sporormia fimetaria CBS 119925]
MVNCKRVAFKVSQQAPVKEKPSVSVINCRKPGRPRRDVEPKSQQMPLATIITLPGQRKRSLTGDCSEDASPTSPKRPRTETRPPFPVQNPKPQNQIAKLRADRPLKTPVCPDILSVILDFTPPAQVFEMRKKLLPVYYAVKHHPKIWENCRKYHMPKLPDPPPSLGITEFQYADLRHGQGCQRCRTKQTRKTYWIFLRRWCRKCLAEKLCERGTAERFLRESGISNEDINVFIECLPSGIIDSWDNFVGHGPSHTPGAFKTHYVQSDVLALIAGYRTAREGAAKRDNLANWYSESREWLARKKEQAMERRAFAQQMWKLEEETRQDKAMSNKHIKLQRKEDYCKRALELTPPIPEQELEKLPSFKRAIAIPKPPHNSSWLQLKPKLEREVQELRRVGGNEHEAKWNKKASSEGNPEPSDLESRAPEPPCHQGPYQPAPYQHPPLQLPPLQQQYGASSNTPSTTGGRDVVWLF